jgi:hypothetical protein
MPRALLALTLAVLTLLAAQRCRAEMREWTDKSGKFKINAEFVSLTGDVVRLRLADGKVVTIAQDKLSTADRDVIRGLTSSPEAEAEAARLLSSLVRVVVPLTGEEGEVDEVTLVGFAIQTAEPSPVIVVSRRTLPGDVDGAEIDAALAQAQLIALRTEDELGSASGSGSSFSGDRGVSDGRDGAVASVPMADEDSSALIILRASPEARIPMLPLASGPPAAGDVVTVAKLPRPQVRSERARRPPIPWTPWSVMPGTDLLSAFDIKPQDGAFPYVGATLPVLNAKKEVVGVLNPGAKALPDKSRVASAMGLSVIRAALAQAGIQQPEPPPPPVAMAAPPPASGSAANALAALFGRLTGAPAAPAHAPPWRSSYEAFASALHAEATRDGQWQIQWGAAPDFGAWYDAVRMNIAASMQRDYSGGRESTGTQNVQATDPAAAQALALLTGVEWTADVVDLQTAAEVPCQLALPPLPDPLRISFVVEPQDAGNWSLIQAGDRVRFAVRFSATEMTDFPTIIAYMTLKEATRGGRPIADDPQNLDR